MRAAAIIYFYTINRVNLNSKHIGRFKPANRKIRKNDKAYSHNQILQLLNCSDIKEKAMVLLMCSTGVRIGALPLLTIGSLQKVEPQGYPNAHLYKIIIYEHEQETHYSYCTFECASAIDSYREFREQRGEVLNENSPLIRENFDTENMIATARPKFLTLKAFRSAFERLVERSGIRVKRDSEITVRKQEYKTGRHLYEVPLTHGFRKFVITQFKKAKVDISIQEMRRNEILWTL